MRLLKGLLYSLALHAILVVTIWTMDSHIETRQNVVEISFETETESKKQSEQLNSQIVRQTEAPEKLKQEKSEDPLSFFSEKTQRVKKQLQAAQTGASQNRSLEQLLPSSKPQAAQNSEKQIENKTSTSSEQGELASAAKQPNRQSASTSKRESLTETLLQTNSPSFSEKGFSTIGEALSRDIEVGSFTALNTDRYLFYSFFSRIDDLIRFRWETLVSEAIERTPAESFLAINRSTWITEIEIRLKPDGSLESATILRESGIPRFDRAATQSFVQARIFPNPPKEMIDEEGVIKLRYGFQVRYTPQPLAKQRQ